MTEPFCGQIVSVDLDAVVGSEQSGRRPAVIISGNDYLASIPNVLVVVPITTRNRGLPNHVRLAGRLGLEVESFAMTEQPRTVDRRRVTRSVGHVDAETLQKIRAWLVDFFELAP